MGDIDPNGLSQATESNLGALKKDKKDKKSKKNQKPTKPAIDPAVLEQMRKEAEERRIKEEEERKIRDHKEKVEATLKSLTETVPLLDEDMFASVGALLDQTEDYPKNMIMVGAMTVQQTPVQQLEEQKAELQSNRKATFIGTLKKQVHTQMMLQNLTRQDYQLKMQEIKELEENQAIDWSNYT